MIHLLALCCSLQSSSELRSKVLELCTANKWKQAEPIVTKWERSDKKNPEAYLIHSYVLAGEIKHFRGDYKLGEVWSQINKLLTKAFDLDQKNELIYVWTPRTIRMFPDNYDEDLIAITRKGVELFPKSIPVGTEYFEAMDHMVDRGMGGYKAERAKALQAVYDLHPHDPKIVDAHACLLEEKEDYANAILDRVAEQSYEGNPRISGLEGCIKDELALVPPQMEEARTNLQKLIAFAPTDPVTVGLRGRVAYQLLYARDLTKKSKDLRAQIDSARADLAKAFDAGHKEFGGDLSDLEFMVGEDDNGLKHLGAYVDNRWQPGDPRADWDRRNSVWAAKRPWPFGRMTPEELRNREALKNSPLISGNGPIVIPQTQAEFNHLISGDFNLVVYSESKTFEVTLFSIWSTETEKDLNGRIVVSDLTGKLADVDFTVHITQHRTSQGVFFEPSDLRLKQTSSHTYRFQIELFKGRILIDPEDKRQLILMTGGEEDPIWRKAKG